MNLNEECLLDYLQNPNRLNNMTNVLKINNFSLKTKIFKDNKKNKKLFWQNFNL